MGLLDRWRHRDDSIERALDKADPPSDLRSLVDDHVANWWPVLAPMHPPPDFGTPEHQDNLQVLEARLRAAADPERRAMVCLALAELISNRPRSLYFSWQGKTLVTVSRMRLAWTHEQVDWLMRAAVRVSRSGQSYELLECLRVPLAAAERLPVERQAALAPLVDSLIDTVERQRDVIASDRSRTLRRLRTIRGAGRPGPVRSSEFLRGDDNYGRPARAELLDAFGERDVAATLSVLGDYSAGVTPTKKWRTAARSHITSQATATAICRLLLERLRQHREDRREVRLGSDTYPTFVFLHEDNVAILRAAVWALADVDAPWVTPLLGDVAEHCGIGMGGSGGSSRCGPVTTSAVAALVERSPLGAIEVVAQLARVKAKVQNKTIRTALEKAVASAAESAGMSPGELVERAVPDFGLKADGPTERRVGDHVALLSVSVGKAGAKLDVRWLTPAGREVKAVPKAIADSHPDDVAELRSTARELKKAAATQRARLEDLLACQRTWTGAEWRKHYIEHPVVGAYARDLIWVAGDLSGLPVRTDAGWALRNHNGQEIGVGLSDEIRLWHPISAALADVRSWRIYLADAELRQPFKQAFREIYLLTPAEEETANYSNRFAAHILKYPQAGALMRTRGWAANHLGPWDGGFDAEAVKEIGADGWRARFYIELVDQDGRYDAALCSTDQVRFERRSGTPPRARWDRAPLAEVPELVFSEAMRDVDLFVGVTSVANDPRWTDRGDERYVDYWHDIGFGELTESAQLRRDALARLLPRTKIADQVELTDRFLLVRGVLHEYKIHLGSTNILMSPADTYLCIVVGRDRGPQQVFLPFEEDGGKLAVILSKAFLLADDTAITDPDIVRQIQR